MQSPRQHRKIRLRIDCLSLIRYNNGEVLPLAPVAALRESSVIFGTVIGALVLKEGFGARRITAAILVTCGIAALAMAG